MSFQEVTMYRLLCDRCGVSAQEDTDYYAWADKDQAKEQAVDALWLIIYATPETPERHYCNGCTVYDDDTDEYIPDPEPVAS